MGKSHLKRGLQKKAVECVADVTLDDYANNPRKGTFLRKVHTDLKTIGEPVVSDFDSDDSEHQTNEPLMSIKSKKSTRRKERDSSGIIYPEDVWFHIAKYVSPEDLCKFALICKDAYRVMLSVQFWKQLSSRFMGDKALLPRDLQHICDSRRGLRTRVIRLMYLRCPPLIEHIKPPVAPRYEPYTLHGMKLVLTWHEKQGAVWNYYFKWMFRDPRENSHQRNPIFENPEADCRVLKATCNQLVCFPYPQYCYLSAINLGLTSDMRHQKLSLGFNDYTTTHSKEKMKQNLGQGSAVKCRIELEPISKCILMDWWHPDYPYPREIPRPSLLPCPNEEW